MCFARMGNIAEHRYGTGRAPILRGSRSLLYARMRGKADRRILCICCGGSDAARLVQQVGSGEIFNRAARGEEKVAQNCVKCGIVSSTMKQIPAFRIE